jgi:hypothetical protein
VGEEVRRAGARCGGGVRLGIRTTDNGRRATDRLRGFLATNGEGRGFNPAVTDASNCFLISRPAQLAAASCAGRETNRRLGAALRRG